MKTGLGKGLDKLMEGDKVAAGQPAKAPIESSKPLFGRGVTRLVQGSGQAPAAAPVPAQSVPSQAVPSQAVPSQAVPSQAVPSQAVPSQTVP
ncbi:MAG: hypothetical protein ACO1QB_00680, partial [Verrucomicrobiales bacterium]